MASEKVEICLKKKKPTPSTIIPLFSNRQSEQLIPISQPQLIFGQFCGAG